jgi:isopenicillin N synthase-like dioxygenase
VVNHGVREDVVRGFRDAAAEFFAMPAEKKLPYCSDDQSKPFRLASSTSYDKSETRYWRDYLKIQCYPITDDLALHWPAEPSSFKPCDEGMTNGPPIFAYLVFGPGRVSLERLSRPIKAMV